MAMHVADSFRSNMRLAARNFAATELLTDISVSSTQLRVKDSTKYPSLDAGEYFLAVLSHANDATKKEIIKVTGVSGDTWTILRAYEGTTAFAFPAKSAVECRLTAGTIGLVQGMTAKRPSGASHVAYPYHEYYVDGGSVVTFDLANFMDGQRAIVRCLLCATAQRVTLRTGSSDFFYLADERSYAEVTRMGDTFYVTASGSDTYYEWEVAAKGATIPVGSSVRVIGVDGVFDISFAQGASAKSPISVKFEGLGLELGRTAKIKLLGGEQFDVPSRDSELIIDSDCVLTFQRVNGGRWGILDGVGLVGSYHALSRKIEELESWPQTGTNANGRWTKYRDGRLECEIRHDLGNRAYTTQIGALFMGVVQSWTFPHVFVGTPVVQATSNDARNAHLFPATSMPSTTEVGYSVFSLSASSAVYTAIGLTAVGRWK